MMRVDAYTHFIPTRFFKEVMSAGNHRDIGKRMMGVPSIYDVNVRLKVVDKFKDYAQVLSYPMPPFELMTKNPKETEEYAKIVNDGFAELCKKHPDHFPG
jgi:aminocarboxymuconate-semialdehyde decarboxylase